MVSWGEATWEVGGCAGGLQGLRDSGKELGFLSKKLLGAG